MVVCSPEITMGCRVSSLNATNKELETTISKPYAAFEAFSCLKPQSLSKLEALYTASAPCVVASSLDRLNLLASSSKNGT